MNYGFNYKDEVKKDVTDRIVDSFLESGKKELVFMCIGTDKCIGDAIGPFVGTKLKALNKDINVYGTLHDPAHALTIDDKVIEMHNNHPDAYVIGIDACLGEEEDIGQIRLRDYPISPGKGVGKDLQSVGEMSIICIVDNQENSEFFFSRSIRLSFILDAVDKIVEIVEKSVDIINDELAFQEAATTVLADNVVRAEFGSIYNKENEIF